MNSTSDRFVTVDGHRFHYVEAGDGPPLVLLHSGGASARQYGAVIPMLAAKHRVIAWDMLGHGDTDPLTRHLTMEDHGALLAGFIAALGLGRITLSGSSIGGYIAMAYAASSAAALDRLILVEAPFRSSEWYRDNWAGFEAMCAIPDNTMDELKPRFRDVTPELHKRWNIDRNKAGSWTMVDIAWACRDFDAADAYARIMAPTSFLVGSNGPTLNEKARMEALRPDIRVNVIEGCGHFPMIDDPDGFVRAILSSA